MGTPHFFPVDRPAVVGAERDELPIGGGIVDAAALYPGEVVIILVHEMHRPDKEGIPVEFTQGIKVLHHEGLSDQFPELGGTSLFTLPE